MSKLSSSKKHGPAQMVDAPISSCKAWINTSTNAEWAEAFFSRNNWTDNRHNDQLAGSWMGAARTMLAAATLLTNDPAKISRHLGLPLPYVSATIWNLDRNIHWVTEDYKDLIGLISADSIDEARLSDALLWAMERFWEVEQAARIDLIRLWQSISWSADDDVLPISGKAAASPDFCQSDTLQ
ncbi:MAG: hypothetical protein WCE63_03490 [Acidobacteriaceae bacterium]